MILGSLILYFLCWRFPIIMAEAGVSHHGLWFMDTYAILAALDAQRLGLDPYAYNPLNYFGGPHVYSHWWLALGVFPLTRADTPWLGPLVSGGAVLTAWVVLRPRNGHETAWALLILCSAPMVLGLNRANVDLLLFALLSLCVPSINSHARFWRVMGTPLLVALATGLKYYPAVAGLIVLAVHRGWERRLTLALAVSLLVLVGVSVAPELTKYISDRLPQGLHTFGAPVALLATGLSPVAAVCFAGAFLLMTGWWFMHHTALREWNVPCNLQTEYLFFIMGAVMLSGSFVATVNYGYRWIYAIWMIPFLCRAQPSLPHPALGRWLKIMRRLLLLALWGDAPVALILNLTTGSVAVADRWIGLFTALQQPFLWAFFGCLSGWLVHFVFAQLTPVRLMPGSSGP